MLSWSKRLSRTDAQVPTKGYPVQYLRFTQSGNPQDVWVWFRSTFFGAETWRPATFGKNAVERADVKIDVTVLGKSLGTLDFFLTYDISQFAAEGNGLGVAMDDASFFTVQVPNAVTLPQASFTSNPLLIGGKTPA